MWSLSLSRCTTLRPQNDQYSKKWLYATEYMLGSDDVEDEVEYDSPAFVDWLILRYVAAARASYAMTEADGQRILDGRQKTEQRELAPKP